MISLLNQSNTSVILQAIKYSLNICNTHADAALSLILSSIFSEMIFNMRTCDSEVPRTDSISPFDDRSFHFLLDYVFYMFLF